MSRFGINQFYISLKWCAAIVSLLVSATNTRAESLVTMLSTTSIEIASNYTGAEIAIFGAVERDVTTSTQNTPYKTKAPYSIVIAVKAPNVALIVRRKELLGPIWVNSEQQKFANIPGFYAIMSSDKLSNIMDTTQEKRLNIGLNAITSSGVKAALDPPLRGVSQEDEGFQPALIRMRSEQKLFFEGQYAVVFRKPNIFSANLVLPANAPLGRYEISVYLFAAGTLLAQENSGFYVRKIGFEAITAATAKSKPFIYGLLTALIAVLIGWLASVIFRRN